MIFKSPSPVAIFIAPLPVVKVIPPVRAVKDITPVVAFISVPSVDESTIVPPLVTVVAPPLLIIVAPPLVIVVVRPLVIATEPPTFVNDDNSVAEEISTPSAELTLNYAELNVVIAATFEVNVVEFIVTVAPPKFVVPKFKNNFTY